jgi:hypothetical protein
MTTDQMRASGQRGVLEVANMFQFHSDASEYFTAVRDLDLVRELNPELQNPRLLAHPTQEPDPVRLNSEFPQLIPTRFASRTAPRESREANDD